MGAGSPRLLLGGRGSEPPPRSQDGRGLRRRARHRRALQDGHADRRLHRRHQSGGDGDAHARDVRVEPGARGGGAPRAPSNAGAAYGFGASPPPPPASIRAIIAFTRPPGPSPEMAMSGTSFTLFSPRIAASCIAVYPPAPRASVPWR